MKLFFTLSLCLFFVFSSKSQNPNFTFVKGIGGTGNELGYSTTVDASGNIITTGLFSGTMDFDPGPGTTNLTAVSFGDGFVTKMDANGNFLWAHQIGGAQNDYVNAVATDASGNVYVTGMMGTNDIFIEKLNPTGSSSWSFVIGLSGGYGSGNGIAVDDQGNVYVVGECGSTMDFDPGAGVANLVSVSGTEDVFVAKYTTAGNYVWAKRMGGADQDYGKSIAVDASYNVYTTGYWSWTADFDPGAGVFNMSTGDSNQDAFISKLDASGNFVFAKQFAGSPATYGLGIALDPSGGIYSTGYFIGTIDFDPGAGVFNLISSVSVAIYISKLDASGNFVWAKAILGNTASGNNYGYSIVADNSNVYVTGTFTGTLDFDPGVGVYNLTSAGLSDIYVCKLDLTGNFNWAFALGGTSNEDARSIDIDANQNVYVTGYFGGTVDFDPNVSIFNLTANGSSSDAYILKLSDCTLPTAPTAITGNTIVCSSSSNTYSVAAVSGATSYTWSLPSGWSGTSTTNSITATASSTSGNISVTANSTCGSSTAATLAISVLSNAPSTPVAILGTSTICSGTSNIYSVTPVPGATSYTWSLPSGWTGTSATNSITATANTTSGSITVTANNTCGSSSAATLATTVNTPPTTPSSITGSAAVCLGSSNNYSVINDPSATSYSWVLPSGWSGTSTSNSISATAGALTGNIIVTANNNCGSSSSSVLAITAVLTTPVNPGTISGSTSICDGSSNTYSVSPMGDASTYNWTLPSGWSGTSTNSSINTIASLNGGTISVTGTNFCGTSTAANLTISVNSIPATPGTISGTTSICEGSSNNYTITAVSGATSYSWSLPSGWSGSSTTNNISTTSNAASGNITVTANNICGNSSPTMVAITVNSLPSVSLALSVDTLCVNASSITLSGESPIGGTYSGAGVSSGSFDASIAGVGSHVITYLFTDANSCTNTSTDTITVNACIGIDEQISLPEIQIYPSPTSGLLTLLYPKLNNNSTISIYNVLGETIYSIQTSSTKNQFDLSHVEKGIYFIQIKAGKETIVKKIVKE